MVSLQANANGATINVNWSANDPSTGSGQAGAGLAMCLLQYRVGQGAWQFFSEQCAGLQSLENAEPGAPHTFQLSATDNVGNENTVEAEATTRHITKYYHFSGQRVAKRGPDGAVTWLHGDHLGSTSLATSAGPNPQVVSRQLYYPFGESRWSSAALPTDFGYTGQREARGIGLYDYHARFYDPYLGRFISADSIIPNPSDPQDFNRYTYVRNNPLAYTDPDGHCKNGECQVLGGGDHNRIWELYMLGEWYEGFTYDEFRAGFQAGLDAANYYGDYYTSRPTRWAKKVAKEATKALCSRSEGCSFEEGVELILWSQLDPDSWQAVWAAACLQSEASAMMGAMILFAPPTLVVTAGPNRTYSGETYPNGSRGTTSGGSFGEGRKLRPDERIVVFESKQGSGTIKTYDPRGISAQSLDEAGTVDQAHLNAFRRPISPGEPYWITTGQQIARTGRFAYFDAGIGNLPPGHVSIWGGRYLTPVEFIKIWLESVW